MQAGSSNLYAICQADVSTFYFANYNCGTPTLCSDNSECGCGSFCWQAMSLCL